MTRKNKKTACSSRRQIMRLEQRLAAIEAQIKRLEKNKSLGLAAQDHFVLWRRPALFAPLPSDLLH